MRMIIDTETEGLDPNQHRVLSISVGALELDGFDQFEMAASKEWHIKYDEYHITEGAQKINHLTPEKLDEIGITPEQWRKEFTQFITDNFDGNKITLVGHNVWFDAQFLNKLMKSVGLQYNGTFSHRFFDTASLLELYAIDKGLKNVPLFDDLVPKDCKEDRHTALGDIAATLALMNKLITEIFW